MKVKDFDRVVSFYKDGLGYPVALSWGEDETRAVMIDIGNNNFIEIFGAGNIASDEKAALIHFALHSQDCDADLGKAKKAGAVVTMEPTTVTIPCATEKTVRIAFCKGLNGEIIEFFQEI